ncbi:MAG TPA: Sir2 family NAD-dependent protein deacetylase [Phycisphaerae bacterium]|nr:iron dicitrate transport regulator FecR [Phycisphaerae bacterium]HOB75902.1 Sir2 family NAD-dependent protein deacetylase [Phycisphaerae bacterium]HOJ54411.1 Sir2 family NAD-dependent protein deacetylase [Phycisphaerae bacterium]HOL26274.1 Sir2 family NAD-dependent protein deacetylase [Phycisphaerae bacterium]HPP20798.1 Sir2 family NAD-dependent protein deacetylase [Phycisphaerae bacterium]
MHLDNASILRAAEWLRSARHVVVFTGAGVSVESGIATFRDSGGFWQRFPPDQFANWNGLLKIAAGKPKLLAEFLLEVLAPVAAAAPNPAHRAIADLEKHTRVTVITQNVDRLHQDAGSTTVHEVHGSLFEIVGKDGEFVRLLSRPQMQDIVRSLQRAARGPLTLPRLLWAIRSLYGPGRKVFHRPSIVLFGDAMAEPAWSDSWEAARECDCFLIVGTSCVVMPAAMLPHEAQMSGASVIGIGPEEGRADVWLRGPAGEILPRLVRAAFGQQTQCPNSLTQPNDRACWSDNPGT